MKDEVVTGSVLTSRRNFMFGSVGVAATLLTGCASRSRIDGDSSTKQALRLRRRLPKSEGLYPALLNEPFAIEAVRPGQLPKRFQRQLVNYKTREKPGTVIVDTSAFYLYHVRKGGKAMRYGVGLGRAGFAWSGRARIAWKKRWPKWTPPAEMIARQPELAKWGVDHGGMPPGLDNPLGARALYIFQGGEDTLYRLHGTPEISSIGKAVSSGCVRLVNHDIIHLYDHVRSGSTLVVV